MWFYQDFESENLCFFKSVLSSCSENTGPVTRDHVKSSQMWKGFSSMLEQVQCFYFLEAKFINIFKMAVNFEICSAKFTLVIGFQISNGRHSFSRIRRKGGFPLD